MLINNNKRKKKIDIFPEILNPVDNLSALIPPNESERLSILQQYLLLDSSSYDASYDRYTTLCHRIFKVFIGVYLLSITYLYYS